MQSPTNQGVLNRVNSDAADWSKQKWYLHDSAKRSGNFSADVFLNCSFDYIGFILPPSQQNNSLRQQNSGNPIVAILGTFATVKIR
jgi:hypothetical protein